MLVGWPASSGLSSSNSKTPYFPRNVAPYIMVPLHISGALHDFEENPAKMAGK